MKTDKLLGGLFMLFAGVMFTATSSITDLPSNQGVSSRFWPICILSLMFFLSFLLTLKGQGSYSLQWKKIFGCILCFIGYVLLLKYCGYIVATLVFQTFFLCYLGIRGLKVFVFSAVCTALLTGLFHFVLDVLLPNGEGIFRTLNIFLLG